MESQFRAMFALFWLSVFIGKVKLCQWAGKDDLTRSRSSAWSDGSCSIECIQLFHFCKSTLQVSVIVYSDLTVVSNIVSSIILVFSPEKDLVCLSVREVERYSIPFSCTP